MLDLLERWHCQSSGTNIKQGLYRLVEVNLLHIWCLVSTLLILFFFALFFVVRSIAFAVVSTVRLSLVLRHYGAVNLSVMLR